MKEIVKIDKNTNIRQSNRLIEAKYRLTKYEQRMVIAICSQLDSNSKDFETIKISVADMAKFCNFDATKAYSHVKKKKKKLSTRSLEIKMPNGDWYITHWLQSSYYRSKESVIEYNIDPRLKPELLQLKAAYLSTAAAPLMEFNRDYSARLYFLLKKMLKIREFTYDLDFFRDRFQLSKSYQQAGHMKDKIFEPAIYEINEKSDIQVEHEYIKEGRSYKKIHFVVTLKKAIDPPSVLEQPPQKHKKTAKKDLTAEEQEAVDRLIKRGVSGKIASNLVKKYGSDQVNRNRRLAVQQKDTAINLPGLIISFIKADTAGDAEKAKAEVAERERERQEDARQAYMQFHGETDISGDYSAPVIIDKKGKVVKM